MMYEAAADGELDEKDVERILQVLADNVRNKTYDSDIEATYKFYQDRMTESILEDSAGPKNKEDWFYEDNIYDEEYYVNTWVHWYYYRHNIHQQIITRTIIKGTRHPFLPIPTISAINPSWI